MNGLHKFMDFSFRTAILLAVACLFSGAFCRAQDLPIHLTLTSDVEVVVTDPNTAGTVDLYKVSDSSTCPKLLKASDKIALKSGISNVLTAPATPVTLTLAAALNPGETFCAADAPTSASVKPLVSAVYTYIPNVAQPVFTKPPMDGSTTVAVHATASDTATTPRWKANIQLLQLVKDDDPCDTSHGAPVTLGGGTTVVAQQTDATGSVLFTTASTMLEGGTMCAIQTFSPLTGTTAIYVGDAKTIAASEDKPIGSETDWGLVRAYFTGGIALANDSSNFSAAYEFLALDVDKAWLLPGNYLMRAKHAKAGGATTTITLNSGESYTITGRRIAVQGSTFVPGTLSPVDVSKGVSISGNALRLGRVPAAGSPAPPPIQVRGDVVVTASGTPASLGGITFSETSPKPSDAVIIRDGILKLPGTETITVTGPAVLTFSGGDSAPAPAPTSHHLGWFGVNSYFEARLTAIPVSSNGANTAPVTGVTSPTATASFISTQKTARVGVGVYEPFLLTRWKWNAVPNALFIAPLAKIGFDTLTSGTQQSVVVPGGGTTTETYQQVYNFRSYGARIGHMKLSHSTDVAPEVYSYLDIGIGPYSNLESLVCGRTEYVTGGGPLPGQSSATAIPNSQCISSFPASYVDPNKANSYEVNETRTRVPRLDLEGLLKIPSTPIYVGFNANIAQKVVGRQNLDPAFKAPDDVRFFFGTKFDIATLVTKLGAKIGN